MAKKRRVEGLSRLSIGRSAAEKDLELNQYYINNPYYAEALDFVSPTTFFVGRKGAGKSSILQMIRLSHDDSCLIDLYGDDFALQAIASNNIFENCSNFEDADLLLYKTIWQYMIIIRILKRALPTKHFWLSLIEKIGIVIKQDKEKQAIIKFLKDSADLDDEKITFGESVLKLLQYLRPKFSLNAFDGTSTSVEFSPNFMKNPTASVAQISLFKQVNSVISHLDRILEDKKYYVLIDDLDLNWHNKYSQNAFIKSLFSAILKLSNSSSLKFVVALREDIFVNLGIEDSDKVRDHIIYMNYDSSIMHDIIKRRISYVYNIPVSNILDGFFSGQVENKNPLGYINSRSRNARDMIQFTQLAIDVASGDGAPRITSEHILQAEYDFSRAKINDLEVEFKYVFYGIDHLITKFSGSRKEMSYEELQSSLETAIIEILYASETVWAMKHIENLDVIISHLAHVGFLGIKASRTARAQFFELRDIIPRIEPHMYFAICRTYHAALLLH